MTPSRFLTALLSCPAAGLTVQAQRPPAKPAILDKAMPENVEDLRAIEKQVEKVLEKLIPATVCVRFANSSGSGVIVSAEGHVLTAGHVSGAANRDVILILHDGKVKGKTLGGNHGIDSGMVQIPTRATGRSWRWASRRS